MGGFGFGGYNAMQQIQTLEAQLKAKDDALKKLQDQIELENKQLEVEKAQFEVEHKMVEMKLISLPQHGALSEERQKLVRFVKTTNHDLKAEKIKKTLEVD